MATNSDIFSKLKGLFIVEEENANKTSSQEQSPAPTPQNPTPNSPSTPTYTPPISSNGAISEKVFESLVAALSANNMEGFDYFEYRTSLLSLAKMPMDEQTRFQSAFAMAQTMGATPQKLLDSGAHYLNVLKNEELKFQQAFENQKSGTIVAKEQEAKNLDGAINQKAEQIKRLTEEIQQHQAQIETLKKQIGEIGSKAETAKNDFSLTYQSLVGQIQADLSNISKYLK
jgi:hypothetical protein